jgi:hypothetical protein
MRRNTEFSRLQGQIWRFTAGIVALVVGQKKGLDDAAARGKLKDFLLSFLSSGRK